MITDIFEKVNCSLHTAEYIEKPEATEEHKKDDDGKVCGLGQKDFLYNSALR